MWGHQKQMESSQHSCFWFWWPGLFLLEGFCRSPMAFTRDLCKTDLVIQTLSARQSGAFHESVWHEKCYFEMSPLPLTHLVFSVFRYWTLFVQSRSEPFLQDRHACHSHKPMHRWRLLRNLVAWSRPQGIQTDQVWVGWSTHSCPLLKSSSALAVLSAYSMGKHQSAMQKSHDQDRANGSGCCSCSSVESLTSEISN